MSTSVDPDLVTWARPLTRAERALRFAGEAAEFRQFDAAQRQLAAAIRELRLAHQIIAREERQARANRA